VRNGFVVWYDMYGTRRQDFTLSRDNAPGQITAQGCHSVVPGYCSAAVQISAQTAPTIVDATFGQCLPDNVGDVVSVSGAARGSYILGTPVEIPGPTAADPPSYDVTLTWTGAYSSLAPITHRVPAACTPTP
jgi:hypothetical protein